MTKYVIDKAFKTSVERSPRVLEVSEAYGLGLSDKVWKIYDKFEIEVKQGDVVYITGQSGSGKSLLLRELHDQMKAEGLAVADIEGMVFDSRPLIDQIGESMTEASILLAQAGINDAYLQIRRPTELSDGQRYRLKLAKLIETKAQVWVADEFGAILDRVTAKVVAFNMQKMARKMGATLIVATTHLDLVDELGPDLMITKRYKTRVDVAKKDK